MESGRSKKAATRGRGAARIVPYRAAHAASVRSLFLQINRELTPPGMEQAFAGYVERALREEIDIIEEFYDRQRGNGFWVMTIKGKVIGFVGLERHTAEEVELRRMYLEKRHRGQGLAELLLERAKAEATELRYTRMVLSTSEIQKSALAFYRRMGFRELRRDRAPQQSYKVVGGGLQRVHFAIDLTRATSRPVSKRGRSGRSSPQASG